MVFKGMSDNTVTVQTQGNGLCGLDSSEHSYYGISLVPTVLIVVAQNPIPSNGNFASAGQLFNPYAISASTCNPSNPETCQVFILTLMVD